VHYQTSLISLCLLNASQYHERVSRCCFQKQQQLVRWRCLLLPEVVTDCTMQMFEASRSGNRSKDADILWHPQVVTDCKMQFFCCFQKQQQIVRCMCMYDVSPGSLVRLSYTSIYYIHCWEMMNSMGFFSHGSSYCYS
jgi:hypothetical protein